MQTAALKLIRSQTPPPRPVETEPDRVEPVQPDPVIMPEPANEPSIGLVYGAAPDPMAEIPVGPDATGLDWSEGEEWTPKTLDLESEREDRGPRYLDIDPDTGSISAGIMSEEDFITFWSVDAWEIASGFAGMFRVDISDIETEEDELEQGRKAAKRLYQLANRHPRFLGWMLSNTTQDGGDWMICASFFGGKALAVMAGIKERRDAKREQYSRPVGTDPDPSGPVIDGEYAHG